MTVKGTSLGNRIGSYGIDRRYLFQQMLIWGILLYTTLVLLLKLPVPSPERALLIFLGLYLLTVVSLSWLLPRIDLYENGIVVVEMSRQTPWRWNEIVRIDGQRGSYGFNGIPLMRWGANHFHNRSDESFSVGAWMANASPLVDFIMMKMTELRIPAEVAKIEQGSRQSFGKTHLSRTGIEKNGVNYPWSEIRRLSFQYWTETRVTLELKKGTPVRLDNMDGTALYLFAGVVDHYTRSGSFHELQQDTIRVNRRVRHAMTNTLWLVVTVVVLTILGVAGVSAIFMIHALTK